MVSDHRVEVSGFRRLGKGRAGSPSALLRTGARAVASRVCGPGAIGVKLT